MISSRTPEGAPNRCPLCGRDTRLEPSTTPSRDAPCPHCRHLLWFSKPEDERASISRLANEIVQISKSKISSKEYFRGFLERLLEALAAPAGAVWLRTPEGNLQLEWQERMATVGLDQTETIRRIHDELLRQAAMKGQPGLLYLQSTIAGGASGVPEIGNPTNYVVLLAPILVDKQVAGLVEVWQGPERGPDAQRGLLQFIVRMSGLASAYVRQMAAG